jgi:hypothetical protein
LTKESKKVERVPKANSTVMAMKTTDVLVITNPEGSSRFDRAETFGDVIKVGEVGREEEDDNRGEAIGDDGLEGDIAVECTSFIS